MNAVFLDTVGLLATWDSSDQWHEAARSAFEGMSAARRAVVTTSYVLLECGNAAARRPYRATVARFRREFETSGRLIVPTDAEWDLAWAAYESGAAGGAGIVDHISFVVMRRLGISEVFTNDRHFAAAGFQPLF